MAHLEEMDLVLECHNLKLLVEVLVLRPTLLSKTKFMIFLTKGSIFFSQLLSRAFGILKLCEVEEAQTILSLALLESLRVKVRCKGLLQGYGGLLLGSRSIRQRGISGTLIR